MAEDHCNMGTYVSVKQTPDISLLHCLRMEIKEKASKIIEVVISLAQFGNRAGEFPCSLPYIVFVADTMLILFSPALARVLIEFFIQHCPVTEAILELQYQHESSMWSCPYLYRCTDSG